MGPHTPAPSKHKPSFIGSKDWEFLPGSSSKGEGWRRDCGSEGEWFSHRNVEFNSHVWGAPGRKQKKTVRGQQKHQDQGQRGETSSPSSVYSHLHMHAHMHRGGGACTHTGQKKKTKTKSSRFTNVPQKGPRSEGSRNSCQSHVLRESFLDCPHLQPWDKSFQAHGAHSSSTLRAWYLLMSYPPPGSVGAESRVTPRGRKK